MAYESNDARNRSESYKEGGKVEKDPTKGITDESTDEMYIRINEEEALKTLEEKFLNLEKKGKGKVKYKRKKGKGNIA